MVILSGQIWNLMGRKKEEKKKQETKDKETLLLND